MPLGDSITALVTDTLTIRRTTGSAAYVDGVKQVPASTTFTCDVTMQPAFGLNRVIGGADMQSELDGQHVTDVRVFNTLTEVRTRTPTNEPDVVEGFEGANWTVARTERWPTLDGGSYWRVIITKQTGGAS